MTVEKLKEQLMERIDPTDLMQVEKVERYINLLKIFNDLDKDIEEHGTMVVTINGSQSFTKPNPAIAEKVKINAQLLNIEKSFVFEDMKEKKRSAMDLL